MFDQISNQAMTILSLSVGGVSILSIVSSVIYMLKQIGKAKREIGVSKSQIETAFKDAVLPKNIKLDVSKRIELPIKEGLAKITAELDARLKRMSEGERLILTILSQFTHLQKLPKETQDAIADFIDEGMSEDVAL